MNTVLRSAMVGSLDSDVHLARNSKSPGDVSEFGAIQAWSRALFPPVSGALLVAALLGTTMFYAPPALADGGDGGGPISGAGGLDSAIGAGGPGGNALDGGGGGGAGATGGLGGSSIGSGAGGNGGATAGAAGAVGGSNTTGGGGGGGGAHGFVGAGLPGSAVTGGAGGAGGDSSSSENYGAGGGGAGGWGLVATDSGNLGTLTFTVTGGNGGSAGNGSIYSSMYGAQGGSGGNGLVLTGATLTLTIGANVSGGDGGNGGATYGANTTGGDGGNGGTGFSATDATVTINSGVTVLGGDGGIAGLGVNSDLDGTAGAGGAGIVGSGLTVINNGTISGGFANGGAGARANAITFTGDTNVLELRAGSTINGNVVAFSTADTLRLGGATNSTFDLSDVGAAAQYRGFGTLEKTGTSTWTLSGTGPSALGWKVGEGTLDMGGTSQTAASFVLTGGELSNGTLNAAGGFDVQAGTASAVLAGSGGLTKTTAGTVTLSAVNAYTGATSINGGTLALSGAGSIAASSGVDIGADGAFDISGTTTGASIKTLSGAGNVDLGSKKLTITAGGTSYGGAIGGTGGFTIGTGATQTLTGDSSAFSGATTIEDDATLMLASTAKFGGTTTAKSGGLLAGTGSLASGVIESGGFIAPGDASGEIGTLSVTGPLSLKSGSTFLAEVGAPGSSDLLAVTGAATIEAGAILDVKASQPYELGAHYTLLTSSGLTGGFGIVTGDVGAVSAFFSADVTYDYGLDSVFLDVMQVRDFADAALTRNQIATAWGVDSLPIGNDLFDAVAWLPTDAAARGAFNLLSGEIHASAKTVLIEDSTFLRNAVFGRLTNAGGGAAPGISVAPLNYAAPAKAPAPFPVKAEPAAAPLPTSALWTQAFGAWGSIDGDGNAASLDRTAGGFFIGADALVTESWRLGVLGGYSRSSFDVNSRLSSGDSDNYHAGLYAGGAWGALSLKAGAAYTWSDVETTRSVLFPGYEDYLKASYDARTAQIFGELAYRLGGPAGMIEPFAGLAYVNLDTDGFTEDGGDAALTSASATSDVTYTTLGLRASTEFALGQSLATLRGMAGWQHAFGDTTPLSTFAFEGSLPFSAAGLPVAENALVLVAGLDFALSEAVSLGVSYSGQFGDGSQTQGVQGSLAWRF